MKTELGVIASAALLAGLFVYRFESFFLPTEPRGGVPTQAPSVQAGLENAEAAALIKEEFWYMPRPIPTISFKRPPEKEPLPEPEAERTVEQPKPRNVCERNGGQRIEFMRGRHLMWRCAYRNGPGGR